MPTFGGHPFANGVDISWWKPELPEAWRTWRNSLTVIQTFGLSVLIADPQAVKDLFQLLLILEMLGSEPRTFFMQNSLDVLVTHKAKMNYD